MRQVVEIFRKFGEKTGHQHMQLAIANYRRLLEAMDRPEAAIVAKLREAGAD